MLSIERTKELVDPNMTDEEAEVLRNHVRAFAEVMYEQWRYEKAKKREAESAPTAP